MRYFKLSTLVLLLGFAAPVWADYGSIDLGYLGRPGPNMGLGGRFDYDIVNTASLSLPVNWELNQYDSPSGVTPGGQDGTDDLFTFCVQTSQSVPGNSNTNTYVVDPAAIGGTLDRLGDYYFALASQVGNGDVGGGLSGSNGLYSDSEQAGAFQLATWEITLADSDFSTTPPNFAASFGSYTQDAIDLAKIWLASVIPGANQLPDLLDSRMVFLLNGTFQDQVTQITAVPEASALIVWTFVGGAIGLVIYRRNAAVQAL